MSWFDSMCDIELSISFIYVNFRKHSILSPSEQFKIYLCDILMKETCDFENCGLFQPLYYYM